MKNIFSARAFAVLLAASALIAANIAQAEPTTEEKKQAVRAAIKAARAEACDAGFEKIMVQSELPQPVYLVLWETSAPDYFKDPDTGETRCSGGSGTNYYGLARVVQTGNRFTVTDKNLFDKMDRANGINPNQDYEDQPKALNNRFIQSIKVLDGSRIRVVADKYTPAREDDFQGNNFPTRRWQYEISVPNMKLLDAKLVCKLEYVVDIKGESVICKR